MSTVKELKAKAKELGIRGYSKLRKSQLEDLLGDESRVSEWKYRLPRQYYSKVVELFGDPKFVANIKGGMAVWTQRGLYNEHILRDEHVNHCVPAKHVDFFYSSIKFYVPPNKLNDVLRISGSINYDGLKKMLTARCGGIGANIATLYLAMKVASGAMTIAEVKRKNLYVKHIRGEAESYNNMEKEMRVMKAKNTKKYKKQLASPRYELAFKKC